jgi:hypothetical protein
MSDVAAHEQRETFTEVEIYPEHAQRTESAEFGRNKRLLVKQLDLPCFICGSREAREVHHFICEWALADVADWDKVLDFAHVFDPYGFTRKAPPEEPMVLCGTHTLDGVPIPGGHHRGIDIGIHRMTFPIWVAQKIVKDGVAVTAVIQKVVDAHKPSQEA